MHKPFNQQLRSSITGKPYLFLLLLLLISLQAKAEIISSAENGFSIQHMLTIKAPPLMVYQTLVNDIGAWWDPAHSYSGESKNFYIDDKAQGCFCEKLQGKPAVRHMEIVYAEPGKLLRMQGGLGPLQAMAVSGSMSWTFLKKQQGLTDIKLDYHVGGYSDAGLDKLADAVNTVLQQQLMRLKEYTERKIRVQMQKNNNIKLNL